MPSKIPREVEYLPSGRFTANRLSSCCIYLRYVLKTQGFMLGEKMGFLSRPSAFRKTRLSAAQDISLRELLGDPRSPPRHDFPSGREEDDVREAD